MSILSADDYGDCLEAAENLPHLEFATLVADLLLSYDSYQRQEFMDTIEGLVGHLRHPTTKRFAL